MRIRRDFPRRVRDISNTGIELSDGCRLAARMWLPEDAEDDPVPALLEYIPYRKGDATALRDSVRHPWFAGHGYAAARVDMRGSGDSDGLLLDEYLLQEQDDALEVISWLAAQPWCTGAVGIIGKSWGGFNGLQIAARRPPELRAVISVYSTDDRYADDVHYMGGCVLGSDMLSWASTMLGLNALPPDPEVVGDRWRELWFERLERTPPFVEAWLSHQRRDEYWKHGSVCEDFEAIESPVFAVGGWADGYTNAVLRLLEGLSCPRKGLIGPWGHQFPDSAFPGPSIGFLQECLRWWDHWLKGRDKGVMDEPMLRAWMQDWVEPRTFYLERPGRWIAEPSWPAPAIEQHSYRLTEAGIEEEGSADEVELHHVGAQTAGLEAGAWCPWGASPDGSELPPDQRREDGLSLTFTSPPLPGPIEIFGFPEVSLAVASDRPNALVAVRLCDVAPGGSSLLVSRGLLNLTHRGSDEHPSPLVPGQRYVVALRLNGIAHAFPAGHRLRIAVSPTYWPHAWPSPDPVTLTVYTGADTCLVLPVRSPRDEDRALPQFDEAEIAPPLAVEPLPAQSNGRVLHRDVGSGRAELVVHEDWGSPGRLPDGLVMAERSADTFAIIEGKPLSARASSEWSLVRERGDWQIRIETRSVMTSDRDSFHVTNAIDAYEGSVRVSARSWTARIPRDLV